MYGNGAAIGMIKIIINTVRKTTQEVAWLAITGFFEAAHLATVQATADRPIEVATSILAIETTV